LSDITFSDQPDTIARPAIQEAARLVAAGKLKDAQRICGQELIKNPNNDGALYWSGIIAAECQQHPAAATLFGKAIEINPAVPEYHANLGRSLIKLKQTSEAKKAADAAMTFAPDDPLTLDTIGVIYSFTGYHDLAAEAFKRVVEIEPNKDSYWYNLGASLKFAGNFDAAEAAYTRAIKLNPQLNKAISALSHMRRQTADSNHIDALRTRLTHYQGSLQDETRLTFALAKEYDDIGQYSEAYTAISDVSKRWRQSISYAIEDDQCIFDALQEAFTAETVENARPGFDSQEPVFIVGMPRTGTTLTERIISSHSAVYSAGELNKMGMLIRVAAQAKGNPDFKPAMIQSLLASDLGKLGEKYIEATRPATGHTPHFIDKMPLNFLYVGFILLALPNAKIIAVRRNPMDTCLSNFRQLFSLTSAYYAYSYDILDCGRYYLMFDRLMKRWNSLFPSRILEVNYEDIVERQEAKTRELLAYCGLDWEEQCLHFEQNESPVATASSAQVRKPIYRTALARWKNYEQELQPLANFFREHDINIDA